MCESSSPLEKEGPLRRQVSPAVSVICIFLNAELYIDEAIKSVLSQTFSDFELILVDDGSTDRSSMMARGYAHALGPKVRYLDHPGHANLGVSAARNAGIRIAKGNFLAFIDADDVWRPHKLAEQIEIMRMYPEVQMVCGTVCYWHSWAGGKDILVPSGHKQNEVIRNPDAFFGFYPFGNGTAPTPSDLLLRREIVQEVGAFEEQFRVIYEDQVLLAKIFLNAPVFFSDRVWLNYRQHPGSCCNTVDPGFRAEQRAAYLNWLLAYAAEMGDEGHAVEDAVRRAMARYYEGRTSWPARLATAASRPHRVLRRIVRQRRGS